MKATGRVLLAALGLLAMLVAAPAAGQEEGGSSPGGTEASRGSGGAVASPVSSVESGQADARAWTTERMANAPSRDIAVVSDDGTVEYVEEPTAQGGPGQAVRVPRPYTNRPDRMVGKIFGSDSQGDYSCSGSVVTTGNQSVVSTAGHCLYNTDTDEWADEVVFVPAYGSGGYGSRPLGTWYDSRLWSHTEWTNYGNYEVDIGAVVLYPRNGLRIQQVVGGHRLAFNRPIGGAFVPWGYPAQAPFTGWDQWRCTAPIIARDVIDGYGPRTLGLNCNFTPGSSGGPWLRNIDRSGTGTVASVTSYRYGGSPILFGPYFGSQARVVYRAAGQTIP